MADRIVRTAPELSAALEDARSGETLRLAAGEYRLKETIRTPGLTLWGAGAGETVLVWDDYANKRHADGKEYNTFRTWTLAVCAENVTMRGLSVVNDALRPEVKGQEVALSVCAGGFAMEDCLLRSTQDTLFLGPLPPDLIQRYRGFLRDELRAPGPFTQRFTRCRVEGTVDFIFGCGETLFEDCELRSLRDARNIGFVAAPAHSLSQEKGFLFRNCRFTCEEGVEPGSIYLARPWRDYGLARFEGCAYGPHIAPAGFDRWEGTRRDLTARFFESPAVPGRVDWANPHTEA